jgi:hypothetical protein
VCFGAAPLEQKSVNKNLNGAHSARFDGHRAFRVVLSASFQESMTHE